MQPAPSKPKRRERRTIARNFSQSPKPATVPMKPIGITPAARAAMIMRCFGCSSTSSSGCMSQSSAKSSPPMFIATTRGLARGISSMRPNASAVSIIVMNFVWPDRHAALFLELGDELVEELHVRRAVDLGERDAVHVGA